MRDDHDEKITLAALLGIWSRNQLMTRFARKTPMTLREFTDKADGLINAVDTLQTLTFQRKIELEQADRRSNISGQVKTSEKPKKGQKDRG